MSLPKNYTAFWSDMDGNDRWDRLTLEEMVALAERLKSEELEEGLLAFENDNEENFNACGSLTIGWIEEGEDRWDRIFSEELGKYRGKSDVVIFKNEHENYFDDIMENFVPKHVAK